MFGGQAPGGEHSPKNVLDFTSKPDIQQTSLPFTNDVYYENNTKLPSESISQKKSLPQAMACGNGHKMASAFMIAYVIELLSMILTIILRYRFLETKEITMDKNSGISSINVHSKSSSFTVNVAQDTLALILGVHVSILIFPLVIITVVSSHWVLKTQDFSGKPIGRLVCWILHIFQMSIIWRFLKLKIAYDPGDLKELGMLRFAQMHLHIFPFLVMHIAITISYPHSIKLAASIIICLIFSSVITIMLSISVQQTKSVSSSEFHLAQFSHLTLGINDKNFSTNYSWKSFIFNGTITVSMTWSRIFSIAILICLNIVWAMIFLLLHWLFNLIWIFYSQRNSSLNLKFSFNNIIKNCFLSFLLLWNLYKFRNDSSKTKNCILYYAPIIYYFIIVTENIAITSIWYITEMFQGITFLHIFILSSVILSQILAFLLLGISYMTYSLRFENWFPKKPLIISQVPSNLVKPEKKISFCESTNKQKEVCRDKDLNLSNIKYGSIVLDKKNTIIIKDPYVKNEAKEMMENISLSDFPGEDNKKYLPLYQTTITSQSTSNNSNSILLDYSKMMRHHVSKSGRSSTENGSLNSRNTNTLPTPSSFSPEYEVVQCKRGASFSDSFSSLSCGTARKVITSTPKEQINSYGIKKLKYKKCYQNTSRHLKILEGIHHNFTGVKELDEDIIHEDIHTYDRNSYISTEIETFPPQVTVVRAKQRFQVVCTKCLFPHDPLLTLCKTVSNKKKLLSISISCEGKFPNNDESSSTDYPSDTDFTTTFDTLSSISVDSYSTYTTWPVGRDSGFTKHLIKEKGAHDYVTAWLSHLHSNKVKRTYTNAKLKEMKETKGIESKPSDNDTQDQNSLQNETIPTADVDEASIKFINSCIQDIETIV